MIILKNIKTDFLLDELKKRGYIMVFWTRENIENAINKFGQIPTPENITTIVEDIEQNFDASVGINWNQIGVYVYAYFNPQKEE